jgi:hypothetical protein
LRAASLGVVRPAALADARSSAKLDFERTLSRIVLVDRHDSANLDLTGLELSNYPERLEQQ